MSFLFVRIFATLIITTNLAIAGFSLWPSCLRTIKPNLNRHLYNIGRRERRVCRAILICLVLSALLGLALTWLG